MNPMNRTKCTLLSALIAWGVGFSAVATGQEGRPIRSADGATERREERVIRPGPGGAAVREGAGPRGPGAGMRGESPGQSMRGEVSGGGQPGMRDLEVFRGYLELVDRFTRLARDPATAGVAAVIQANDILRPRGPEAVIEYFNNVLPQTKNETVQRAIRLQLIDAYKRTGEPEKALEHLQSLITAAPPATQPSSAAE